MKKILVSIFKFLDSLIQKKNIKTIESELGKKINIYIDVGAHKGEMIDLLLKHFKINRIYAFEPNPESFDLLKNKKIKKLKLFNFALGEKNKYEFLKIGHISAMSTINKINDSSIYTFFKKIIIFIFFGRFNIYKKRIKVRKKAIKNINKIFKINKIDLIKIDTEGHEFNVIKGIGEKLIKNIKLILFELHYDNSLIKNYNFKKINKYLNKRGFKCVNQNKMLFRKGFEIIYKNIKV